MGPASNATGSRQIDDYKRTITGMGGRYHMSVCVDRFRLSLANTCDRRASRVSHNAGLELQTIQDRRTRIYWPSCGGLRQFGIARPAWDRETEQGRPAKGDATFHGNQCAAYRTMVEGLRGNEDHLVNIL
jgi:hypothetical protein